MVLELVQYSFQSLQRLSGPLWLLVKLDSPQVVRMDNVESQEEVAGEPHSPS